MFHNFSIKKLETKSFKTMDDQKHLLIESIKTGNLKSVNTLLEKEPTLVDTQTEQGISVLLLAMYYRKNEIVNILLQHKKDFLFFEAAAAGKVKILKNYLVQNPEKINEYATDGFTALGLACFFAQTENVKLLLENGANPNLASNNDFKVSPLHSAAAVSNLELVKLLLENGANVNATQSNGVTALHSSAHNKAVEILKLLLGNGADKNAKTQDGKTALDFAKENKHAASIQILSA